MSTDKYLNRLVRRDWLNDAPLSNVVTSYIEKLRKDEYADRKMGTDLFFVRPNHMKIKGIGDK